MVAQRQGGMVRLDDPAWAPQRNPRTLAGADRQGRTVLITVDGRWSDQLGLPIQKSAEVARI